MSISSITSSSAASQLSYVGKIDSSSAGAARQVPPPPPDGEGGGFISAIADALKSIGVSSDGSEAAESTDSSNAAQALGSFLEELMGALHAQGSEDSAPLPYGEAPQGGPGKLAEDLGSLIANLGSSTDDSTGALESSFSNLLTALGADGSDAASQLGSFLQALASGMPEARTSGNLVNTTA